MKCKECKSEVYPRESSLIYLFLLIITITSYYFEHIGMLFFMAMGHLLVAWIYNSQRPKKQKDVLSEEGE